MSNNFITTNKDLCNKIEHYLPQAKTNIFYLYEELVTKYMNSKRNQIIVDVGSGASCPFVKYKNPNLGTKIIAVDVSLELMKNNHDVDEKRIANIIENFPFENEEVDIITSRSVLEHLEDLERFIINSKRVLKINGYFIHLFPSKFAPFALFNQLLPKKVVNSLLYLVNPKYKGILGFPAFYDRCFYSGIKMLLEKKQL